jgi:hypothetical protein
MDDGTVLAASVRFAGEGRADLPHFRSPADAHWWEQIK